MKPTPTSLPACILSIPIASIGAPEYPVQIKTTTRRVSSRAVPGDTTSSRTTIGCWELLETAGHGSQSDVFFARPANSDRGTPADYAVKRLSPRRWRDAHSVDMFRREAACGSAARHPHLASVLAAHVDEAPYFMVMPRLRGATIRQVMRAGESFSPARSIWIVRQIAEGLRGLHEGGWIHGDIKPDNIMVGVNLHATLFDYGFARRIDKASQLDQEPFCGTLRYSAPELLTSRRRMTPACDVYALGITLFEMLTGQPPFTSSKPASLVESHVKVPCPSVRTARPDLPRSVSQAVASMLAKDPLRRPSSLTELTDLLTRIEVESFALRDLAA